MSHMEKKIFEIEELFFFFRFSIFHICSDGVQLGLRVAPRCFRVNNRQAWTDAYLVPCWTLALVGLAAPLLRAAAQGRRRASGQEGETNARVSEAAVVLCRSKTVLHVLFTAVRAALPVEHLLSEANEVFVVGVDVGELDVYQQQNLQHTQISSIGRRSHWQNGPWRS